MVVHKPELLLHVLDKKKKANGRIKHCLSVVGLAPAKGKAGQEKKKANLFLKAIKESQEDH